MGLNMAINNLMTLKMGHDRQKKVVYIFHKISLHVGRLSLCAGLSHHTTDILEHVGAINWS